MKQIAVALIVLTCLSVAVDLVLPDGKISKYVKGVCALVNVLVILEFLSKIYLNYFN